MANKRFFDDIVDNVSQKAQNLWDTGYIDGKPASQNKIEHPAHPDLSRFMQAVNSEDLSRPNLFLVRFDNFFARIGKDGVQDFNFTEAAQDSDFTDGYGFNKIKDIGLNASMNTSIGKQILGAYNPTLINMIPGGEYLTGLISSNFDVNKDMAMLVKNVSVPGSTFNTTHLWFDKKPMTAVTGRNVDTITMNFFLRTNHIERQVMDKWMNMVHSQEDNTFGFYDTYAKKIDIFPLDRKGRPMSVVQCSGCFPIKLGNLNYDVDSNNEVMTFEVEFAISTFKTASFQGQSPFFDQIASTAENIFTNPLAGGIF